MTEFSQLSEPTQIGDLSVPNRIFMAPPTRNRSHSDGTPKAWAETYYRQRAGAGIIFTEATQISAIGKDYMDTPGNKKARHCDRAFSKSEG